MVNFLDYRHMKHDFLMILASLQALTVGIYCLIPTVVANTTAQFCELRPRCSISSLFLTLTRNNNIHCCAVK